MKFTATCPPGLENLLKDELQKMGITQLAAVPGAVSFEGEWKEAAAVMMDCFLASRLLLELRNFASTNQQMLYDQVRRIPWPEIFPPEMTMAVFSHGVAPEDLILSFASLKIKDAICDEFRKANKDRPSVDRQDPQIRIEAFFLDNRCRVSIDLSGVPLHRRGYRKENLTAPIRENRAAAMVRFADVVASDKVVDPFCGGGTLIIEAALKVSGLGLAMMRDAKAWTAFRLFPEFRPFALAIQGDRRDFKAKPFEVFRGSDLDAKSIQKARVQADFAGISRWVKFEVSDARKIEGEGLKILCNPPYGERLGEVEGAGEVISEFTRQLKHHCPNSQMNMVIPRGPLEKVVGFKPSKKLAFQSGGLDMIFLNYELFTGRRSERFK